MTAHRDQRDIASEERAREGRIAAAIATLTNAGLSVEKIDNQMSLVDGRFEWHRLTNFWKLRGTDKGGVGLLELIKAAKAAPKPGEPPVPRS